MSGTDVSINFDGIKSFMAIEKLSEYGLSKKMDVSYSYVYRVLRGQRRAGQAFIDGLLRIGMQPNDIFLLKPLPKGNDFNNSPNPRAS